MNAWILISEQELHNNFYQSKKAIRRFNDQKCKIKTIRGISRYRLVEEFLEQMGFL